MDFYQAAGKMALGSRLRKLSDTVTEDALKIYGLYNVKLEPRWFPVFYMLAEKERLAVTEIAQEIGQTHASVSQIVKEMKKQDLVMETKDAKDGRKTMLSLSEKGKAMVPNLKQQVTDVQQAVEDLFREMQYDLWKAMEETEFLLGQQNLFERVKNKMKARESEQVIIQAYEPEHQTRFRDLNVEWIEHYFKLEKKDLESLNDPKGYILDKGGHILVAAYKGEIMGVCALLKMDNETYELAKMAVSPAAQGKSIGWLLGKACIEKAKALGAKKLFLESNTKLVPAINLYHKLGFKKIVGKPSPYERSNIQMELVLD
ncbi:bifunctional helix-turn-helix transcriptional regulator/GNAT family N-acetyltransferase [Adhaeribacter soli]|uniref:GNAT family N-acetyltransferase n=1 Tax=Adhaeribacter soli TaxID=2607655 RepID=A0A5N1J6X4_9BACT|nr:bifunctional helix-turn-helix transcriptional regulator/GNAT family N-acetyltransferase [Adhaeribacter soli]KAA9345712.1 GNAT family N-acetyltransferase [Adhaeribacter soli]